MQGVPDSGRKEPAVFFKDVSVTWTCLMLIDDELFKVVQSQFPHL